MPELVTAVIPTYNYGRFVASAVQSVLDQSYPALECVVVDDGSTDDTPEVLHAFGDRIRVIRQENRGLSAARNAGIAEARGRYIGLLDADDWWLRGKVEAQVRWLQQHPSVGCVGCGRQHVSTAGDVITFPGVRNHRTRTETLRAIAVRAFWVGGSGSGAMIRREVLEQAGGFDEHLKASEDWDMWLRLSALTDIDNAPEVLTAIRRHATGMFRNVNLTERNARAVCEKAIRTWPDTLSFADRRKMRALILADAGKEHLASGKRRAGLLYLSRSILTWPFDEKQWRAVSPIRRWRRHTFTP